jgi:sucrose-6-phosphate hydrolase SacC (GH32 family)
MDYVAIFKQPFINLRVKNEVAKVNVQFFSAGQLARYFDVEMGTEDDYDFMVCYDVSEFLGKPLVIKTDRPLPRSVDELFVQSESPLEMAHCYDEAYRPRIHFSAKRGWLNDPNGLVYHEGRYHLFFQHNPFGRKWDNMHWGHAVSTDLFHWREWSDVLYPDELGAMFSGSAVIDRENTSGLGRDGQSPLVLLYTADGHHCPVKTETTQCLAWSTDGGKTFEKLPSNPVLPQLTEGNRDPHVFWHGRSRQWIMSLYLRKVNAVVHEFAIFGSSNLKKWRELDRFYMPSYECPGLYELAVANSEETKWVFWGAEGCYLIGDFDGKTFTPHQGALFDGSNHKDNQGSAYAGQIFSNAPDGRTIKISWMQEGELPGMPFNQFMTLPVDVALLKTRDHYRLCYTPAKEIETCYSGTWQVQKATTATVHEALQEVDANVFDLHLCVRHAVTPVKLNVKGIGVTWDPRCGRLECLGRHAFFVEDKTVLDCRFVVDKTSLEIFADKGLIYLAFGVIPDENAPPLEFELLEENANIDVYLHRLESVWR